MLQAVASRLNGVMRAEDTLSRIGGDEFVILLPQVENREEPSIVAKRVLNSFKDAFVLDDRSISIILSLGMSLYPDNSTDMMTLLKSADDAMYGVKRKGGAGYCMHSDC
jgi:diguanylate cyclase (GGDEF)-like protein